MCTQPLIYRCAFNCIKEIESVVEEVQGLTFTVYEFVSIKDLQTLSPGKIRIICGD